MTDKELHMTAAIYAAIGRLLPAQGRDYAVHIVFDQGRPRVSMSGLTPYGTTFAAYCMKELQTTITEMQKEQEHVG